MAINNPNLYCVVLSYNGVVDQSDYDHPLFTGSYEDCVHHIRSLSQYKWNKLTNYRTADIDIISMETQRLVSYVL